MGSGQLSQVMTSVSKYVNFASRSMYFRLTRNGRDPSQHASLKAEIEEQATAMYSTARLWDDGIIKPTDTRDVVGLGLALAARGQHKYGGGRGSKGVTTWDGDGKGYGVFRM